MRRRASTPIAARERRSCSFLSTSQSQGPELPATVGLDRDGCWTFEILAPQDRALARWGTACHTFAEPGRQHGADVVGLFGDERSQRRDHAPCELGRELGAIASSARTAATRSSKLR